MRPGRKLNAHFQSSRLIVASATMSYTPTRTYNSLFVSE